MHNAEVDFFRKFSGKNCPNWVPLKRLYSIEGVVKGPLENHKILGGKMNEKKTHSLYYFPGVDGFFG